MATRHSRVGWAVPTRCSCHTGPPKRGQPHPCHSERRGAERSTAPWSRGIRSSASRSDTADAVAAWHWAAGGLRYGVERLEINVRPPLRRMLRHGVGCLAEGLFERIPPLRAFGPPVGMTAVGDGRPPHHRHSERSGAEQGEAPRIEEPILQRREATPLMLLRPRARCLVEGLFERVPPRRAFGPPVGMTMVEVYKLLGGMATQGVAMGRRTPPCIARTCSSAVGGPEADGHATRQRRPGPPVRMTVKGGACKNVGWAVPRGPWGLPQRAQRQPGPRRLCGLCDSLWLALPLRAVRPVRS